MNAPKYIWLYLISSYSLPAFSIATFLSLPPAQNYALLLPFFLLIAHRFILVADISILYFLSLNIFYILIAASYGATDSMMLVFAYTLLAFNFLLIYNLSKVPDFIDIIPKFFKFFFYLNFLYLIFQNIVLNLGMDSISMLHSNDFLQKASSYSPTVFIEPFYRVTGLFNESGPFTFYLIIYSWFLFVTSSEDKLIKFLVVLSILIGGSKMGLLYLLCLLIVKTFGRLSAMIIPLMGTLFVYIYFNNKELMQILFFGRAGSVFKRYDESYESLSRISDLPAFSFELSTYSSQAQALDFASLILNNFGFLYFILVLLFFVFITLTLKLSLKKRVLFLCVLGLGLISNGSILIPQYSLLFILIFYINKINKFETREHKNEKFIDHYSNP